MQISLRPCLNMPEVGYSKYQARLEHQNKVIFHKLRQNIKTLNINYFYLKGLTLKYW